MKDSMEKLIDELVDGGSNFAASLGINRVAGQLYVLLFLSARALSLDEMMEKLKISKGHVSTNIRALERWQAVRKVWVKGTRKDYYEANTDTINIVVNQLEYGLKQRFNELDKVIERVKAVLKTSQGQEHAGDIAKKIVMIDKMYSKVNGLLKKFDLLKLLA